MSVQAPFFPQEAGASVKDSGMRLRLYVTGATRGSLRAIANMQSICREYMDEQNTDFQIIDLYANPSSARANQILAAPTLIKELPPPRCRIIGDLSEREHVVHSLGLKNNTS